MRCLRTKELDVRKTNDARWIDQKCTPDVVSAVADIVDSLVQENGENYKFNAKDVWFSKYAREYILEQFNKSDPTKKTSVAEYNKFYQQPLNMLAYAGVLNKEKIKRTNVYSVNNLELLQYIGMSDRNALLFLQTYIKEVLKESGLYPQFEKFFNFQTKESFNDLKDEFTKFCQTYTRIKRVLEPHRIFPKVINPLANEMHKCGSSRGTMSHSTITYTDLMYNKENFRDIFADKPKDVSRQEWLKEHPIKMSRVAKIKADSARAKRYVRKFNDKYFGGTSELKDKFAIGQATQMHHIFPQNEFSEIAGYTENIIALTPSQHFNEAHPKNNTQIIDTTFQELLLKAKATTIDYVVKHEDIEQIYSFDRFAHVLKVGLNLAKPEENYNDYISAVNEISKHYIVKFDN